MQKIIDFYFDFGSPTTYLAWTQLPKIAQAAGAQLIYHPVLLGGIFQAAGNQSPVMIPLKAAWMSKDLNRFSERYGVTYRQNPFFPINTMQLMRAAIGIQLRKPELFDHYLTTIYQAMWVNELNLSDPAVLATLLTEASFDPLEVFALTQDQEVKDKLRADTDRAIQRGIFGLPVMFIGDEMYFGQDRLDFVEEAVRKD
jgi:2-hydroxychromene-2-carboxylate isomerase